MQEENVEAVNLGTNQVSDVLVGENNGRNGGRRTFWHLKDVVPDTMSIGGLIFPCHYTVRGSASRYWPSVVSVSKYQHRLYRKLYTWDLNANKGRVSPGGSIVHE